MSEEESYRSSSPFGDRLDALLRDRRELHTSTLECSRQYWTRVKGLLEKRSSKRARAMLEDTKEIIRVLDEELGRRSQND